MGGFRARDVHGRVDARSVWAHVRGCLELEFRDLEGLDRLDTRFNTPWRLPLAGAGGYPSNALRAPSRHRAELAAGA